MLIEGRVIVFEGLVVGQVARARPGQYGGDDTWVGTPDATCRLNILCRTLRLTTLAVTAAVSQQETFGGS